MVPGPRILLVEDERSIAEPFAEALVREGFEPILAATAADALRLARAQSPDLILLDLMLPDGDGREVCRELRRESAVPILMITARGTEADRIVGLEIGADDYIVKPFVFDELLARLQVHLLRRREADTPRTVFTAGRLTLDVNIRQVSFGEASARLTPREAELLALLMQEVNRPISRGEIFDRLWASQGGLSLNVVDVYVGYLRSKLSDFVRLGGPVIVTVRGKGFMLDLRGQDFRH